MKTAWFISLVLLGFATSAQKLPSVQTESVFAPANIKIDGKAIEWENKFQAYNNHVEFYYTLSNDNNNLYLTVQATIKSVVRHIINGGISLIVNKTGKKNDKDGLAITYPLFEINNKFTPRLSGINGAGSGFKTVTVREGNSVLTYSAGEDTPAGKPSAPPTPAEADSIMKANNSNFTLKAKNIGLKGFKDLDSLISVYNEDGIKAAGTFDNKGVFTYEIAIPLKHLGLDANMPSKFIYHMVINEVAQQGIQLFSGTGPGGSSGVKMTPGAQMGEESTDFWGEYTLAKK